MKLLIISLIVLIVALSAANAQNMFNNIIDSIVRKKWSEPGDLDPLSLDDKGIEFNRRVGFFPVHGIAKFRNISMSGLSKLARLGDVATEKLSDEKNRMTVDIEINNITAAMEGVIRFMGVGAARWYTTSIERVVGEAQLTLDKPSDRLELSKFAMKNMTGIVVKIEGSFKVVDSLTNFVIRQVVSTFQRYFGYSIEFALTKLFQDTVAKSDALKKVMITIN